MGESPSPENKPLVGEAEVPNPLLAEVKSPKSVAFPVLGIVIKSISFFVQVQLYHQHRLL